jgi:inhibitor of KinA
MDYSLLRTKLLPSNKLMGQPALPYRIFPLGDTALTIDFGNCINESVNREVITRFYDFKQQSFPGMIEAVPAYSSITIYYDPIRLKKKMPAGYLISDWVKETIEQRLEQPVAEQVVNERLVKIPVCYDPVFAPDSQHLASAKDISGEELIRLHSSRNYMGEVDERIAIPRKPQPVNVVAGSIGIAGKQTGIYPLDSPGGWQIIGRTPLKLFDSEGEGSTLLQTGDTVQFYPISKDEFEDH